MRHQADFVHISKSIHRLLPLTDITFTFGFKHVPTCGFKPRNVPTTNAEDAKCSMLYHQKAVPETKIHDVDDCSCGRALLPPAFLFPICANGRGSFQVIVHLGRVGRIGLRRARRNHLRGIKGFRIHSSAVNIFWLGGLPSLQPRECDQVIIHTVIHSS